jgi:hypothetical protein
MSQSTGAQNPAYRHGHAQGGVQSGAYKSYCHARQRCHGTNGDEGNRRDYHLRGIEFRFRSFEEFYAELGDRPEGMEVDRIDNDGHYEPGNVRWSTRKDSARNRRSNRLITVGSETRCIEEWAEITGIKRETIAKRLKLGWTVERALMTPPRQRNGA